MVAELTVRTRQRGALLKGKYGLVEEQIAYHRAILVIKLHPVFVLRWSRLDVEPD